MRLVIQRVKEAFVEVDNKRIGSINKGFLVLVGISEFDEEKDVDKYLDKMLKLRIFEDDNGKTNLSIFDVGGELLLVSQFTLYADCRKGNRPSFIKAGEPKKASYLYDYMISEAKNKGIKVEQGEFGADMKVSLINDGPFTIILDENNI